MASAAIPAAGMTRHQQFAAEYAASSGGVRDKIYASLTAAHEAIELAITDKELITSLQHAAIVCIEALLAGNKIMLCGNGGSAAQAQHIAAEFTGRFQRERRALPAIALTTDTSALTAIANDYGFTTVFSRQLAALGCAGDVLIGLSTSGNSINVVNAIATAQSLKIKTIAFVSDKKSSLRDLADIKIAVHGQDSARIQEMHLMFGHILCQLVDDAFNRGFA